MPVDDVYHQLMPAGLRFISLRPRSEYEFIQFLQKTIKRKNMVVSEDILPRILSRTKELGYLDDKKFVTWWIEQRDTHKPKSFRVLKRELQQKGIDSALIEEIQTTLARNDTGHSELERARSAVRNKLRLWEHLPFIERKKKLFGFLGSRGFSHEISYTLVDELLRKD